MSIFDFFKPKKPKKIGLALGSGGAKGMVHLGALKAFEENGIEFDVVAGTSIGSVIGAFYSAGYTSDEIMRLLGTIDFKEITTMFMVKMDTTNLEKVINKYIGDLNIEELKKPFIAVATDMQTGKEVDMESGSVAKALCASSSYPPFFKPVNVDGVMLIDGAFANAIPADQAKKLGADYVVGIDLSAVKKEDKPSLFSELFPNNRFNNENPSKQGYENSNVMLMPNLSEYKPTSIGKLDEMYEIGYQCAMENMQKIKSDLALIKKGKKIKDGK